jgi:hypothetical protein
MTLSDPVAEARSILEAADTRNVVLRLFGGVAFYFRCPSAKHRALQRNYVDIDFLGHSKQSLQIKQLFVELGYAPRELFNAWQGDKRLIFNDVENNRRIDVFLDVFEMCHTFNFKSRLEIDKETITLADMLATKLQIIEINEKDVKDVLSVFADYDIGGSDFGMINGGYLSGICADDWGVYKTFTLNLGRILKTLPGLDLDQEQREIIKTRVERLKTMVEDAPKSFRWKARAKLGERVRWYRLPEADKEVVVSRAPSAEGESGQS